MQDFRISRIVPLALAVLAMAGLALGQAQSGNIYGKVIAEDGSALPGAQVTLTGGGATQVFTTDARGDFRFLNLAPGDFYNVRVELPGFSTVDQKAVSVNLGRNTEMRVGLKLTKVEASVTVSGEAPLLDTRKVGTGATITRSEMDMIPSARDPWVVMQTVPGVQIDRLNVGGNQSGQQSIFVAKGAQTTQGAWNLDGVTVSDMASGASSPTYWDFDAFQEFQVVTGGNDPAIATAGVTFNMVTKRGTNDVHGTARVFITDPAWQAHPSLTDEMKAQAAAGNGNFVGSQITGIQDYGLEVGGPVLRDRLWLWGSYGRQQVDLTTVTNFPDKTTLEDVNGKLNFQVVPSNAITGFYLRGDKRKQGRSASITRPPETTVDQKGPTALYKIEDNQVFSSSLVADAFYSYLDEGFQLVPQGGLNRQTFQDSGAVWHTYAVGASRKTLARLSYARYANQLGAGSPVSPLSAIPGVAYAYYPWNDANSNRLIDAGELDTSGTAIRTINFNPANPSAPVSVHRIDPNLKSQKTDEVVAGVGHELLPNFAVDVAYTYRHSKDYWFSHRIGLTDADYHLDHTVTGTLPDGTPYSAPIYSINGGRAAVPSGFIAENRPNYSQDFNGAELTLNKRLSSGWLMRGSFAYNDSKQKVGRGACVDPTNGISGTFTAFGGEDSVPGICADGGLVAPNAGGGSGSFGNVNLQSKWQFNVSGAYQLPLGFTVAGNFYGRQGYPIAYYVIDATSADGISRRAYATKVDADRYGWAHQLDLRVDKAIPITSTITASLAVDFFNVLNDITITQRNSRLLQASKTTGTNTIFETQSPRILRFSGRISF
ncbi:MAG: TonB-dependent receptor [Acidobacteria bacterium]|nr:TonB-dependent receptor [Acidobacteriota bacterium]